MYHWLGSSLAACSFVGFCQTSIICYWHIISVCVLSHLIWLQIKST